MADLWSNTHIIPKFMMGFFSGLQVVTNFYDSCQSFTVHCVSCRHKAKQRDIIKRKETRDCRKWLIWMQWKTHHRVQVPEAARGWNASKLKAPGKIEAYCLTFLTLLGLFYENSFMLYNDLKLRSKTHQESIQVRIWGFLVNFYTSIFVFATREVCPWWPLERMHF